MGDTHDSLKERGNEAVKEGAYARAEAIYAEALDAMPFPLGEEAAPLHSNRSFALLKLGRLQEALEEAERCVACKGSWFKGPFRVGEAQFVLRDYAGAVASYQKALDLAGDGGGGDLRKRLALAKEAVKGFFVRQLLAGRDFAVRPSDPIQAQIFGAAKQMANFVYLVGDARTRECFVIDAAWDVRGIRNYAEAESMKLVGAIVTHYHFDHTGGMPPPPFDALGITVPGIREIADEDHLPVYVHKNDAEQLVAKNKVPRSSIRELEDGAELSVGDVSMKFLHTPGHTPGSQCVHISRVPGRDEGFLFTGDTLFIGSCGRTDLPDCDNSAMYRSLQESLGHLPDSTKVYPGHNYGGFSTTIGKEKATGLLKPMSTTAWNSMHGRL